MLKQLNRLVVLDALLRTRSPTAAARELGVTQSAVSKALAALRVEMKDPLLLRRGDRMIPTPLALRLTLPLTASLRGLRSLLSEASSDEGPATGVIAMRDQFAISLGPPVLREIEAAGYRTELQIVPYERDRVADELASGTIDLAVAVEPPDRPGLHQTVLYSETFVCLCPSRQPPTLEAYLAARHVSTTAHTGYVGVDGALASLGHERRVAARVPYFAAAVHLANDRKLFVTLPSRVAAALPAGELRLHALPFAVPGFKAQMIWDARSEQDGRNKALRALLRRAAASRP